MCDFAPASPDFWSSWCIRINVGCRDDAAVKLCKMLGCEVKTGVFDSRSLTLFLIVAVTTSQTALLMCPSYTLLAYAFRQSADSISSYWMFELIVSSHLISFTAIRAGNPNHSHSRRRVSPPPLVSTKVVRYVQFTPFRNRWLPETNHVLWGVAGTKPVAGVASRQQLEKPRGKPRLGLGFG